MSVDPRAGYEGVRSRPFDRPPGVPRHPADYCPHEAFAVRADVNRITDGDAGPLIAFDLEIAVDCLGCSTPFEFLGLPLGLSPKYPTSTFDGLTLTAPCRPYGSPADFGLNRPGVQVEMFLAHTDPDTDPERETP